MDVIERNYLLDKKKDMSALGLALILQGIIFNGLSIILGKVIKDEGTSTMIVAIAGLIPMIMYIGKDALIANLKEEKSKFRIWDLLLIWAIMMVSNTIFSNLFGNVEKVVNVFGMTTLTDIESRNATMSIIMTLYVVVVAPIVEEVIYRGIVMKSLEKYGAATAIIGSSILFGTMHQNLIQSPVSIFGGLILAVVAYKYSVKMSITLHLMNNFIVELAGRMTKMDKDIGALFNLSLNAVILILFIAALIVYRKKIVSSIKGLKKSYAEFREKRKNNLADNNLKDFILSKTVILLLIMDITVMFVNLKAK